MKTKKKKQLIDIFGFSKANLLSLLQDYRREYSATGYAKHIDRGIKLVKNCSLVPHSKYRKDGKKNKSLTP